MTKVLAARELYEISQSVLGKLDCKCNLYIVKTDDLSYKSLFNHIYDLMKEVSKNGFLDIRVCLSQISINVLEMVIQRFEEYGYIVKMYYLEDEYEILISWSHY